MNVTDQTGGGQGAHTPGPWRLEYDEDASATMLYGADGQRLAELLSVLDADDRLIVAAPDLLAALGAIRAEVRDLWASGVLETTTERRLMACIDGAVDKATGASR